ncbi:MAG: response regulator [Clostridia bacterium]|nr:response regulator [Clostridia bacterium]
MKRILIVDDSPMIHKILKNVLTELGHDVCGAGKNGQEAIDLYDSLDPDLVFMDITMPVMDGLEAVKHIKDKHNNAKIVMLTAMGDDEIRAEANALGVDLFLKKPFNLEKISEVFQKLV